MASDNNGQFYDDDFDDFETYTPATAKQHEVAIEEGDDKETIDLKNKLNYKTDTSNFNSFEFEIVSPEEANEQSASIINNTGNEPKSDEYADPVLARAICQIENKLNRKINYDEFDKLCKTYAAELANRDAEYKNNGSKPNPIDFKLYYETLLQNRKVTPAHKMHMMRYEREFIDEIDNLYQIQKKYDERDIHVKRGEPVNLRHKGKVHIRDEEKNREIIINNDNDVKLLHMKHRQDWLEKKYKADIDKEMNGTSHDDDGFE